MDIDLQHEEFQALFYEIDVDRSSTIDIDELIYFMTKNQDNISPLASSALMNVKKLKTPFQISKSQKTHKKLLNLQIS